jgi:hypothetical protein
MTQATGTAALAAGGSGTPLARLANTNSFFYATDLNEAYQLPSFRTEITPLFGRHPAQITGAGATIGIVISSVIDPADLAASFNSTINAGGVSDVQNYSAVSNLAVPTVAFHPVNGGSAAFNPNSPDGAEASLDTQMSLGTAPGAKEIVYDMPDLSDANIMAAYVSLMMGGCPGDADLAKQNCLNLPRSAAIVWIGGAPFLLISEPAPHRPRWRAYWPLP